jgi:hypothetical protein
MGIPGKFRIEAAGKEEDGIAMPELDGGTLLKAEWFTIRSVC